MIRTIVKLDLVGSKKYLAKTGGGNTTRKELLGYLLRHVRSCYQNGDKLFPSGILYSSQGDCVYLVIEDLDSAIDQTIDFQKKWYAIIDKVPDCRALVGHGHIEQVELLSRIELVSEVFESISICEKYAFQGQIVLVGEKTISWAKKRNRPISNVRYVDLSEDRAIAIADIRYDNPRLKNGMVMYSMGDIAALDDSIIVEIAAKCPIEIWAEALHGLDPEWHHRIQGMSRMIWNMDIIEHPTSKTSVKMQKVVAAHETIIEIANEVLRNKPAQSST